VIVLAVVAAHNLELAERRKQAPRTVSERNPGEVAAPIVVDREAVEAVHMVVVHTEMEVAVPIAVRTGIEVVQVVRMAVEAVHTEVEVAVPNLAVGLDHKTWIIPPVGYSLLLIAPFEAMCNTILQL
jgi:mannose/fructose/N-acetylgalactosamine-specific phosphotransferase system component IIC